MKQERWQKIDREKRRHIIDNGLSAIDRDGLKSESECVSRRQIPLFKFTGTEDKV